MSDRPRSLRAAVRSPPAWWPWPALAVLVAAGAGLIAYETRGTLFWADEWQWILGRRGGGMATFLAPHGEHLSLVPVAIYKLLFAIVGLSHYWPYRGVLIVVQLACAVLLFVYARRRVGGYFALLATALMMFFGPGWQDTLWPFQIAWLITIAAGIGALLSLDRRDRAGDIGACVLLGVVLASSGPGLAIAAGVVVEVLLTRQRRYLWIVAVPIVIYGLWWIGYESAPLNRHALILLPRFVFDSAAGTLSSLAGLADINVFTDTGTYLTWGPSLLVLAVMALVWRLRRLGAIPPRVVTLLAILAAFWLLTGIGRAYVSLGSIVLTATGDESRYLYVGATFVVLLAAELWRGSSAPPRTALGIGVLVAAAIVSNLGPLRDGARLLQSQAQYTQAELGTLDLSRPIVKPGYVSNGFIFGIVTARQWFTAAKALGSPAPNPAGIEALPDFARQAADAQLIKIQALGLRDLSAAAGSALGAAPRLDGSQGGTTSMRGACVSFRPAPYTAAGATTALELTVAPRGIAVSAGAAEVSVAVRRFSTQFDPLGTVAPGTRGTVMIAADLAPQPWHVSIASGAGFEACGLG